MSNKNILITGIAGFIGFHLARALLRRGDRVIGVDNLNDYYDPTLKEKRRDLLVEEGAIFHKLDVCDQNSLEKIIEAHQIDHIAHLAAQAGVRYSLQAPSAYLKSNIDGFLSILEICRKHPKIKLIYASSSSVYGKNEKVPFDVMDKTDHQTSLYGATKKANELMAHSYHHLFGIKATALRYFTVYGPWGRPDMASQALKDASCHNKPIPVFNHGNMERDFTYIDDIVDGTVAAIDLGADFEIFNLGNHNKVPLNTMIQAIERALNKKATIEHLPMQAGDVKKTWAQIDHSKNSLNYNPKWTIDKGIPLFVDWYKNNYAQRNQFNRSSES